MIQTSNRLEGIGEYYFSQKLREIDELNKQRKNIINLGIGSPDLPPHPDVIRVARRKYKTKCSCLSIVQRLSSFKKCY
jgi:aspartate/methionine/tyrosine aminotransferase